MTLFLDQIRADAQKAQTAANAGDLTAASHWAETIGKALAATVAPERDPLVQASLAQAQTTGGPAQATIHTLVEALVLAYAERDTARSRYEADRERHRHSDLSDAAIDAIREVLNANYVPPASFIDDHVGHAIVQRNKLIENLRRMRETPDLQGDALHAAIDAAFEDARIDPRILHDRKEDPQEDS